mmetsp:Transcript_3939/g.3696  ORF Transcript_3939/g.3696 Transcript_3939/m.3696 type:complete len:86 (-) Transcript_3939:392-649(-)
MRRLIFIILFAKEVKEDDILMNIEENTLSQSSSKKKSWSFRREFQRYRLVNSDLVFLLSPQFQPEDGYSLRQLMRLLTMTSFMDT